MTTLARPQVRNIQRKVPRNTRNTRPARSPDVVRRRRLPVRPAQGRHLPRRTGNTRKTRNPAARKTKSIEVVVAVDREARIEAVESLIHEIAIEIDDKGGIKL